MECKLRSYEYKDFSALSKIVHDTWHYDMFCSPVTAAELTLFVVNPTYRKAGIGKALFQSAFDYIHSQLLKSFYLFTDTSCNFGFYEHQGMKRRIEKTRTLILEQEQMDMQFFIYNFELSA